MFVKVQNTKLLKRTTPTRQVILSSKLPQEQFQKQAIIRPSYTSSEFFYTDVPSIPEKTLSIYGRMKGEGLEMPSIAQSFHIPKPQNIIKMSTVELKETNTSDIQIQPFVVSGFNFVEKAEPIQAKPSLNDSLQKYTQTVRRKIESQKRYPLTARKAMIEGRVGIKMTILNDGQLDTVEIIESSGYEILDKSALESIHSSAPFTPLPRDIERKRIQMIIYLIFKMM